ncbi:hypothetical protein LguiB_007454 [Lonicera macranthoides]
MIGQALNLLPGFVSVHEVLHTVLLMQSQKWEQHQQNQDLELELGLRLRLGIAVPKDFLKGGYGEEGVESKLMRISIISGTPLASISISLASPPLKPYFLGSFDSNNNHHGFKFNPLFESSKEVEINRFRSSPPPIFKFLGGAEEKLMKKLVEKVDREKIEGLNVQDSSGVIKASSRVLPLASSPNSEREREGKILNDDDDEQLIC